MVLNELADDPSARIVAPFSLCRGREAHVGREVLNRREYGCDRVRESGDLAIAFLEGDTVAPVLLRLQASQVGLKRTKRTVRTCSGK